MSNENDLLSELLHSESPDSQDKIFALVYAELRSMAMVRLNGETQDQTIGPTALVHEVYLRFCQTNSGPWKNRAYFFGAAAEAMRRIVVERARQKRGPTRGGKWKRIDLDVNSLDAEQGIQETLDVNFALESLEQEHPEVAALVKLRYFAGFGHSEAADSLGISRWQADRYWVFAKAYLIDSIRQLRA